MRVGPYWDWEWAVLISLSTLLFGYICLYYKARLNSQFTLGYKIRRNLRQYFQQIISFKPTGQNNLIQFWLAPIDKHREILMRVVIWTTETVLLLEFHIGLIRPPVYGSNGRSYKMLVMFSFFLSFFFFFRHAFSEFPRPIALKLWTTSDIDREYLRNG